MKTKRIVPFLLAALLCLAAAVGPGRAAAEDETAYIVKRKGGSAPFEVVGAAEMRRLAAVGALEWYEPDGVLSLAEGESAPYYAGDKWDLALVGADAAFARGCLGQGVRIGILDSGVAPHALLAHCLRPGRNYVEGADADDTADNYGHGTLVAGLIAGAGEDGYLGAAPGAELVPLKITDGKAVKVSVICRAIYGAIDDYGCDVLNLSVGVNEDFQALNEAIGYAEAQGVTVVAAVGNNGNAGIFYPAAYETVIGVGSVDRTGARYYRSNRNESVFLTAPGVNVKTTGQLGGYVTATGTSFAVPFVSAAAAVMRSIDETLTPAELRAILAETAEDRGAPGRDDDYGYGLLCIADCVAALAAPRIRLEPETGPAERICSGAEEAQEIIYFLAQYDEAGRCLAIRAYPFSLAPGESAALEPPEGSAGWAQFFCDAETLAPLTAARSSE